MEKKVITRKDLIKNVYSVLSMAMLTVVACTGVWIAFSLGMTGLIIGATIFGISMNLINVSTSLSNDIYADKFYILSATVTKIIEDGTFYVGNIQLSPKRLFGEHEDIEENDDVYIVYVKNYPVSVMKKDSVKLDEDLKKFVKKAKGVC